MNSISRLRCSDYNKFVSQLRYIEGERSITHKDLDDLSQFFENNKEYIDKNTVPCLDSLALKIRRREANSPLIEKIRNLTGEILPADQNHIDESRDFLRQQRDIRGGLANWINLMEIPLAALNLDQEELENVFPLLTHIDLTDFDDKKYDLKTLVPNFGKFTKIKYSDETIIIGIAKAVIASHTDYSHTVYKVAENMTKLDIKDPGSRAEIAKLCASSDASTTAHNIKNFDLDENERFEVAKICASQDAEETIFCMARFDLKDDDKKFELAKLCHAQDGKATTKNIKNFDIKDGNKRFELAKLCATQDGQKTAAHIRDFDIEDEEKRFEVAKLAASQDASSMVESISNFDIEDEDKRLELAKLAAQQNVFTVTCDIDKFNIKDENKRVELAKFCAAKDAESTAYNIALFDIKDESKRFEIAELCVKQDGIHTALYLKNFDIKNGYPLFVEIIKQFALFPERKSDMSKFIEELISSEKIGLFKAIRKLLKELPSSHKEIIEKKIGEIEQLKPHAQNRAVLWLVDSLLLMKEQGAVDWMLENGLWSELCDLRRPDLRAQLTPALFAMASSEDRRDWDEFIASMGKRVQKGQKKQMLLAIPLWALGPLGLDFAKALANTRIDKNSPLNDVSRTTLLEAFHLLSSSQELSPEQKSAGFSKICPVGWDERAYFQNASAARGLLQIKEAGWTDSHKDLPVLFRECFEKLIPLQGFLGDALQKYEEIFAESRNPTALIAYAAGLKTLGEPELLTSLGRYVSTAFSGTLKTLRFSLENNPHLAKIHENYPDILQKWQGNFQVSWEGVQKGGEKFDLKAWVTNKLIVDKHLEGVDLSYLSKYLNAQSEEDRKSIFNELLDEYKKDKSLKLPMECIRLVKAGETTNLKSFEHVFSSIQKLVPKSSLFAHDIRGILEALKKPKEKGEIFTVLASDDPIDLLLCGTDVSGSCQHVEQSPDKNKGLLGYLLDGKNRVLVIKDGRGKIVARSMLRLLWDGEKPVLFRERFYPDALSVKERDALNALAKQIAAELGMTLTSFEGGAFYGKDLQALGGPAPYEYSDAAGGVQANGRYSIQNVKVHE